MENFNAGWVSSQNGDVIQNAYNADTNSNDLQRERERERGGQKQAATFGRKISKSRTQKKILTGASRPLLVN